MALTQAPPTGANPPQRLSQSLFQLLRVFFWAAISAGLALAITYTLPQTWYEPTVAGPYLLNTLTAAIAAYYLTMAIHELGHVAGGLLAGLRFVMLSVGPLRVTRQGWGVRLDLNESRFWLGGFSLGVPTDDYALRRRVAMAAAGGPFSNAVQLVLVCLLMLNRQRAPIAVWPGALLDLLVLFSTTSVLLTAWPRRMGAVTADGAKLLTLLKGGPQAERLTTIYALTGASTSGVRPRDLNPVWLQRALSPADESAEEASANFFCYFHALDAADLPAAAAYLDRALLLCQKLPQPQRVAYFLEAAYFEARHGGSAAAARAWLDQVKAKEGLLVEPHTRWRAKAAVLLAEGHPKAARDHAKQGLAVIGRSFDLGGAITERDLLNEIITLSKVKPAPSTQL